MPFTIENPLALVLLLALPAVYLLGRDRLSLMSPWRRRAILGVRLASMGAVILALSGPSMPVNDASMSVVFLLDSSDSMAPATRAANEQWVSKAVSQMGSGDRAAVINFAGDATVSKQLGEEKRLSLASPLTQPAPGTDLSTALKMAAGLLPPSGLRKVVLLSDGWDTAGQASDAARTLPAGTRLDVYPQPAMDGQPEVLVESVSVPSYVREGDGFDVSAVVGSNHEGSTQVSMAVDGKQAGSWTIQFAPGANLVTMPQKPLALGFHSIRVQLSGGGDTIAENNWASGYVVVKQRGQVLLVDGQQSGNTQLRRELEGSGLKVDEMSISGFPTEMGNLLQYDGVVLNDVSGRAISLDQMKMLDSFVKDHGRGLFVVGGLNSYGLGDYVSRPLEQMLPVSSDSPITKERGDMALILVIDKSGSMDESSGGVTKIAMAREAAIQAVGALKPNDQIGVIAFDTDPEWIVPMERVAGSLNDVRDRISRLQSSGGTDIYTALRTAYSAIQSINATQKHVILLTDGQSWRGPYQSLLQSMNQDNVTLSTIAIGSDADTGWLSELARLGNGRYYFTNQFSDIPQIVIREVNAATKVAKVEGQVEPQLAAPSPILRGLSGGTLPPLGGYVATKPKDTATTVLRSDRGDPLLAQWQYGLGRVVAWTSDTEGLWSSSWIDQPQYSRVWDQAVRWSMAPPVDRSLQVSSLVDGNTATISVDSVDQDGLFINLADTKAQITGPDGSKSTAQLQQMAPGHYEAVIPATKPGLYRLDMSQARQGQAVPGSETSGFAVSSSPEFRRLGSNDALLKELAAMTGGQAIHDPTEVFSRQGMPTSSGWQALWGYLLTIALVMLPVEIAIRRIRALPFGRPRDAEERGEVVELNPMERDDRAA
jgi:Ca-activated chloride channel homolog